MTTRTEQRTVFITECDACGERVVRLEDIALVPMASIRVSGTDAFHACHKCINSSRQQGGDDVQVAARIAALCYERRKQHP